VKVIGHKGAVDGAPENTRSSLERALALGVDAVEIDVWPTADGKFIVFHDAHLARITGHSGWTTALTSDELKKLDVGSSYSPEFSGERILLLEEALDILSGQILLILELKRTRHEMDQFAWVEERLAKILSSSGALPWTLVISFDHAALLSLREMNPHMRIGMLYAGEWLSVWTEAERLSPEALLPHWAQTTPQLVDEAHQRGLSIYPWLVNHDEWMTRFMEMNVDGIITDRPEQLLKLLGRVKSR